MKETMKKTKITLTSDNNIDLYSIFKGDLIYVDIDGNKYRARIIENPVYDDIGNAIIKVYAYEKNN